MTFVNVHIETGAEWRAAKYDSQREAELKFWEDRATELQRNLENIWDHVKRTGRIELHRDREKMVLIIEPTSVTQG